MSEVINNNLLQIGMFHPFFTPEECRRIIALSGEFAQAGVVSQGGSLELNTEDRRTLSWELADNPDNAWIYERVRDAIIQVNQQHFGFRLSLFSILQLLRYEPSGFYRIHPDLGSQHYSSRKLSIVIFLTDPGEYDGGELIFYPDFPPVPRQQGMLVLFPSYLMHEVRPVTRGVRYSMVAWTHGEPFR